MKAAIVERPGELSVREVAEPVMGDYDCLCENLYGATCSGTDLHLIQGRAMPFPVRYPLMLGHETIGRGQRRQVWPTTGTTRPRICRTS